MSVVATVTVYECDECNVLICVRSDEEFADFESAWHTGLLVDFCPNCRHTQSAQLRISAEKDSIARLLIKNEEVLNAEFIN